MTARFLIGGFALGFVFRGLACCLFARNAFRFDFAARLIFSDLARNFCLAQGFCFGRFGRFGLRVGLRTAEHHLLKFARFLRRVNLRGRGGGTRRLCRPARRTDRQVWLGGAR